MDIRVTYYNPPADFTLPSPPYFRPATSVVLTCYVEGASRNVSYLWSSTNPNSSFVVNQTTSTVSETMLTSNDTGNHTCSVSDSDGNSGSSTIEMQLIGKNTTK